MLLSCFSILVNAALDRHFRTERTIRDFVTTNLTEDVWDANGTGRRAAAQTRMAEEILPNLRTHTKLYGGEAAAPAGGVFSLFSRLAPQAKAARGPAAPQAQAGGPLAPEAAGSVGAFCFSSRLNKPKHTPGAVEKPSFQQTQASSASFFEKVEEMNKQENKARQTRISDFKSQFKSADLKGMWQCHLHLQMAGNWRSI